MLLRALPVLTEAGPAAFAAAATGIAATQTAHTAAAGNPTAGDGIAKAAADRVCVTATRATGRVATDDIAYDYPVDAALTRRAGSAAGPTMVGIVGQLDTLATATGQPRRTRPQRRADSVLTHLSYRALRIGTAVPRLQTERAAWLLSRRAGIGVNAGPVLAGESSSAFRVGATSLLGDARAAAATLAPLAFLLPLVASLAASQDFRGWPQASREETTQDRQDGAAGGSGQQSAGEFVEVIRIHEVLSVAREATCGHQSSGSDGHRPKAPERRLSDIGWSR
jgi:hypothetical protein